MFKSEVRRLKDEFERLYLRIEGALELLHDMATDDPCNKDYRTGRLAAA